MGTSTRNYEIIHAVLHERVTLDEIGRRFGITKQRVSQIARREGVTHRGGNTKGNIWAGRPEQLERVLDLLGRGMGVAQIAADIGMSYPTLRAFLIRKGLYTASMRTAAYRNWTPEEDDAIRARYRRDGNEAMDLAFSLDRSTGAVRMRARALGLAKPRAEVTLRQRIRDAIAANPGIKNRALLELVRDATSSMNTVSVTAYLVRRELDQQQRDHYEPPRDDHHSACV